MSHQCSMRTWNWRGSSGNLTRLCEPLYEAFILWPLAFWIADKPDFKWCFLLEKLLSQVGSLQKHINRVFSHSFLLPQSDFTPSPLFVPGTLCQGLKRRQLETSRRPRCEEKRIGEEEKLCVTLRGEEEGGMEGGMEGGKGEAASDDCRVASKCQCPKIVPSYDQTEDTKQTTALRSSKHRLTHKTRQTVKLPSVFRSR